MLIADTPASPCIKLCVLDTAGRVCLGCGRTIEEITGWSRLDPAGRQAVLTRIAALSSSPAATD